MPSAPNTMAAVPIFPLTSAAYFEVYPPSEGVKVPPASPASGHTVEPTLSTNVYQ